LHATSHALHPMQTVVSVKKPIASAMVPRIGNREWGIGNRNSRNASRRTGEASKAHRFPIPDSRFPS